MPINVGGLIAETLSDLDPSGNYIGYLNDSYNSNQYLFRQFSDGIFSARIIIKNGTSTRIGIMACYVPTGYDGRAWSWFDPVS